MPFRYRTFKKLLDRKGAEAAMHYYNDFYGRRDSPKTMRKKREIIGKLERDYSVPILDPLPDNRLDFEIQSTCTVIEILAKDDRGEIPRMRNPIHT